MNKTVLELGTDQIYAPSRLTDEDLTSLDDGQKIIGQDRALEALEFGIRMEANGYNIFCTGPKGVGRTSLSLDTIKKYAATQKTPDDWCFVHNFNVPHQPIALNFPAGKARQFEKDIQKLAEALKKQLTALFSDESYKIKVAHIEQKYRSAKEDFFFSLKELVQDKNVTLIHTDDGVVVAPKIKDEVLDADDFNKLPKPERKTILEQMKKAQDRLEKAIRDIPAFEVDQQKELDALNVSLAGRMIDAVAKNINQTYARHSGAKTLLKGIRQSILDNVSLLLPTDENTDENGFERVDLLWSRFSVNVIVSHKPDEGAPVLHVNHPTLSNLLGKIERIQLSGTSTTDFSLIRPGALHQANGGYLVIEAHDLLENQPTWNALKRCLFSKKIKMESGIDDNSIFGVISQDPAPIPLSVKVILIGEPSLYYALAEQDDEFGELFKIQSRFAEKMERTVETERSYARLLANLIRNEHLKPFSSDAIRRTIEQASRWANDQEKLSTYLVHANDLMREANYIATCQKVRVVRSEHVEQALRERRKRFGNDQKELMTAIRRGMIAIDTKGKKIGQLNALVVYDFGIYSFGKPTRVTCQVRLGKGELVDIEREVKLGGPIHSKGVFILSSFLASRFAQKRPISLDASLVFEQSYSEVDGDSASVAELACLLSAVANVPLKQSLAVTGSVNQLGEVQAVGAVNEKIEGFFEVCKMNGLTGTQGVIIPATTTTQLMLNPEIVTAVQEGKFHIYAVRTIDEAMELLTDLPSGICNGTECTPENSINGRVEKRLNDFFDRMVANKKCCYIPSDSK
ncbi:MAG: AAA family ATPase [Alphaproteobacteria bacterium]|nr:AAA family ATPase [Alphaproteobacteria bacterium]